MKKEINSYYVLLILLFTASISFAQKPPLFDSIYVGISNVIGSELELLRNEYKEPHKSQPQFGHSAYINWESRLVVFVGLATNYESAKGIMYGIVYSSKLVNNKIEHNDLDDAYYRSSIDYLGNSSSVYIGRKGNVVFHIMISDLSNHCELANECGDLIAKILIRVTN